MNKESVYLIELDILRMFAAVFVVIFHFGLWSYPMNIDAVQAFFRISNVFVGFFFLLSGFILVYVNKDVLNGEKFNAKKFYIKRILRILPIYFVALIGSIFFLKYTGENISFFDIFLQVTFLQAWVPGHSLVINFVAWSLSVEIFFYLIFPILFQTLVKKFKVFFYSALVFWTLSNSFTLFSAFNLDQNNIVIREFTKFSPILSLGIFMFGMLLAKLFVSEHAFIKKMKSGWLFGISILCLFVYAQYIPLEMKTGHVNGLLILFFVMLMFGALNLKGVSKKVFNNNIFIALGKASYGIYIYQVLIYWIVYDLYKKIGIYNLLEEEGRFYVYLVILLGFSFMSYHLFERKIIMYFRNR